MLQFVGRQAEPEDNPKRQSELPIERAPSTPSDDASAESGDGIACYEGGLLREVTGAAIRPGGSTLTNRAAGLCRFAPGARVLDAGCGPGASVELLRDAHGLRALGVDRSVRLLAEACGRRAELPLCRADAAELPFPKGTFHGVFCECVLSLLPDPTRALAEFHRVLLPGGRLVLTDMYARCADEKNALREFSPASCLQGATSREETEARVRAAGFSLLVWEDHTPYLRELLVRLIFAGAASGLGCGPAGARAKPGYYLLIAGKEP